MSMFDDIPGSQHALDEPPRWPSAHFARLHHLEKQLDQCNTITLPIQDPKSFDADVINCAELENTDDGLLKLLSDRAEQRCRQLRKALADISTEITAFGAPMPGMQKDARRHLNMVFKYKSIESFARFCGANYARPSTAVSLTPTSGKPKAAKPSTPTRTPTCSPPRSLAEPDTFSINLPLSSISPQGESIYAQTQSMQSGEGANAIEEEAALDAGEGSLSPTVT
jgi:hypothetical protein